MTDATRELEAADGFERAGEWFAVRDAEFDARVRLDDGRCVVRVTVPTLGVVVVGGVADVVEEGWYETLDRRLDDIGGIIRGHDPGPIAVRRQRETVVVETDFEPVNSTVAADARAVVNFVVGTWFQGVIPGYEYVEAVEAMCDRASGRGGTGPMP